MAQEGIFTRFEDDDKIPGQVNIVSSGMWSGGIGTLTSFYTSSTQSGSTGEHYYDVYNGVVGTNATASVQFSVAYGNLNGSGSLSGDSNYKASQAVYSQLRNLLLTQNETQFKFGASSDTASNSIFAVAMNRNRLKEKMDPGNWELHISGALANGNGSTVKLIDDSGATSDPNANATTREFNIISGSIATGTAVTGSSTKYFGKFYPESGLIILDSDLIGGRVFLGASNFNTASNTNNNNSNAIYMAISASNYFAARREEQIKSTHYFCRVKHGMYNHSQNPTYYSGSDNALAVPSFRTDPKSYITTVGLYNDSNELLAVAKLSRQILKSTSREALIKVRLDF